MNNIYYRFLHLATHDAYRSHAGAAADERDPFARRSIAMDFELWCTAVSAINGCGTCVDSHEKTLREKGVNEETVLAAIRLAAVIHATGAGVRCGAV